MAAGWERAIARVLGEDGPVGAAFLIPGGLLLTCTHVITGLTGLPDDAALPADAVVKVDFPLAPGRGPLITRPVFSRPVAPDQSGDFAVLRFENGPPEGVTPLRLLAADNLAGHRWRAFGFPGAARRSAEKDAGVWTSGVIEGREGTGWWQLTVDHTAAFPLTRGFSGGPVWDEQHCGVAGIIVAVEADARLHTGYALTVESLEREWPQLREHLLAGNPYRGLRAFTEDDDAAFFGRDAETDRLVELVDRDNTPIVPVLGASGVGKSSLVSAGLISKLRKQGGYLAASVPHGLTGSAEELLAWALTSAHGLAADDADWPERWRSLADFLATTGDPVAAVARLLDGAVPRTRLLLVVDQFEGLMVDAPRVAARLDTLLGALTARHPDGSRLAQALVVMRIDFLRHLGDFPNLAQAWNSTHVIVPPMTRDQLREVISRPAAGLGGIRFADGLTERLLHDAPAGAAALPLLEFTLTRLWEAQQRGELTMAAYQTLGGVGGALAGVAEHTLWSRADAAEREALERVFIQLVRPGDLIDAGQRTPDTRRVADRAQFDEPQWALVRRLASTRLLAVTRQPTGADTVELAHEALIGAWPRLAQWVDANRDFRSWQEGLRQVMRVWRDAGRDPGRLLGRAQLADAQDWIRRRGAEIPADEADFIAQSARARARERRRRRLGVAVVAVVCVLGAIAGLFAAQQHGNAVAQRGTAVSNQIAVQADQLYSIDPKVAAQLYLAAYRTNPTPAFAALLATAANSPESTPPVGSNAIYSVVFSLDGRVLAVTDQYAVQLWDVSDPAEPRSLESSITGTDTIYSMAFSPDGRTLAIGSDDLDNGAGTVRLWNVSDPAHPRLWSKTLETVPDGTGMDSVDALAFSPDGHTLASGNTTTGAGGASIQLWNVADPAHPISWGPNLTGAIGVSDDFSSMVFSPDGHTLATGSGSLLGSTIQLWNVTDPAHASAIRQTLDDPNPVGLDVGIKLAFSPDGRTLASGVGDKSGGRIRLWNITDPAHSTAWSGPLPTDGGIGGIAFGPNGILVSGDSGGTIRLWNVSDPRHPVPWGQPLAKDSAQGGISSLAFSADGRTLASAAGGEGVQLWDMNPDHAIKQICATTRGALTSETWRRYFPQLPYSPPCG